MSVSDKLKSLRLAQGLSQAELAEEIGLSMHSINSYESGRREPNSKAMATLESYFNVSGAYLRGDKSFDESKLKSSPELTDAILSTSKQSSQEISQTLSHITKAGLDAAQILKAFAVLSADGQKEMLKRVEEYAAVENQKEQSKKAQKNSHPKDDYELSYIIAAKSGTWQSGIGREEILDEVKELPSESPDL